MALPALSGQPGRDNRSLRVLVDLHTELKPSHQSLEAISHVPLLYTNLLLPSIAELGLPRPAAASPSPPPSPQPPSLSPPGYRPCVPPLGLPSLLWFYGTRVRDGDGRIVWCCHFCKCCSISGRFWLTVIGGKRYHTENMGHGFGHLEKNHGLLRGML